MCFQLVALHVFFVCVFPVRIHISQIQMIMLSPFSPVVGISLHCAASEDFVLLYCAFLTFP